MFMHKVLKYFSYFVEDTDVQLIMINILFRNRSILFILILGDDASKVKWVQLDHDHNLYASHEKIIQTVVKKHKAYEYWHDNP